MPKSLEEIRALAQGHKLVVETDREQARVRRDEHSSKLVADRLERDLPGWLLEIERAIERGNTAVELEESRFLGRSTAVRKGTGKSPSRPLSTLFEFLRTLDLKARYEYMHCLEAKLGPSFHHYYVDHYMGSSVTISWA